MQDVGNGRSTKTRITIIVGHVWEQTSDARSLAILDEYIAVITIPAHCGENYGHSQSSEVAARCYPGGIVINPADRDVT